MRRKHGRQDRFCPGESKSISVEAEVKCKERVTADSSAKVPAKAFPQQARTPGQSSCKPFLIKKTAFTALAGRSKQENVPRLQGLGGSCGSSASVIGGDIPHMHAKQSEHCLANRISRQDARCERGQHRAYQKYPGCHVINPFCISERLRRARQIHLCATGPIDWHALSFPASFSQMEPALNMSGCC